MHPGLFSVWTRFAWEHEPVELRPDLARMPEALRADPYQRNS